MNRFYQDIYLFVPALREVGDTLHQLSHGDVCTMNASRRPQRLQWFLPLQTNIFSVNRGKSLTAALLPRFVGYPIDFCGRRLPDSQTRPSWLRLLNLEQNTVGQSKWEPTCKNAHINRSHMCVVFFLPPGVVVMYCRHTTTNQLPPQLHLGFYFYSKKIYMYSMQWRKQINNSDKRCCDVPSCSRWAGEGASLLNSWGKSAA